MDVDIANESLHFIFEPVTSIDLDFQYLEEKIKRCLKDEYIIEKFAMQSGTKNSPNEVVYKYTLLHQNEGKWGSLYLKYRPRGRFHEYYLNIYHRKGYQDLEQKALNNLYKKLKRH